ncbi:hypothetical protein B0T16DRAFT_411733 [Cercophora newfieldiana]|uniref:Uncharacterized protein n=1 Tax=Cercophora newfieldiana TaxID=92897 RepID=A0AA40CP84_9PEZI|nr:hypothetical protein B0T16DRAFT_411733 [Cercophora newfieldiana]
MLLGPGRSGEGQLQVWPRQSSRNLERGQQAPGLPSPPQQHPGWNPRLVVHNQAQTDPNTTTRAVDAWWQGQFAPRRALE